ncbi:MAG: substrate-binding domain-containing protein, partial [Bacillota bacterium]
GAYQATDYLTRLGHTRIGFITLPYMKTASIRSRLEGYQSALEHNDIPFDEHLVLNVVEYGEYLDSSNEAARSERIRAFLEEARPTAVFCITDDIALDVLKVAHMEGIRIPAEVSVVGFDDVEYAKLVNPPLTTVAQRRERLGRQAMKLVNDRIKGNLTKPKRVVIPTYLVTRGSTAPLGGTSESRDTSSAALSLR